jgi:inhibitor of cysteine peptidase
MVLYYNSLYRNKASSSFVLWVKIDKKRRARMFTKITLTLVTLILLISLAGCGAKASPTPTTDSSGSQADSSQTYTETNPADNQQMLPIISGKVASLTLDASADGTTQQLKPGEVMMITLESNPSTGYNWFATIADTNVLVQMGEAQFDESSSSTPIVGAPGKLSIYFQAVNPGTTSLTLDYQRGWETGVAPAQIININVEVQ